MKDGCIGSLFLFGRFFLRVVTLAKLRTCTVGIATDQRQVHPAIGSSIPHYDFSHGHAKYSATSGDNVPRYRSPRQGAEIVRRVERRNDLVSDTPPGQSVASGAHVDQRRVDEDHELTPFLHLDHHSKQDTPQELVVYIEDWIFC